MFRSFSQNEGVWNTPNVSFIINRLVQGILRSCSSKIPKELKIFFISFFHKNISPRDLRCLSDHDLIVAERVQPSIFSAIHFRYLKASFRSYFQDFGSRILRCLSDHNQIGERHAESSLLSSKIDTLTFKYLLKKKCPQ